MSCMVKLYDWVYSCLCEPPLVTFSGARAKRKFEAGCFPLSITAHHHESSVADDGERENYLGRPDAINGRMPQTSR